MKRPSGPGLKCLACGAPSHALTATGEIRRLWVRGERKPQALVVCDWCGARRWSLHPEAVRMARAVQPLDLPDLADPYVRSAWGDLVT